MDKREFRAEAKKLDKVVSEIEENRQKKEINTTYTIKVSNVISRANNCLKLGAQKTLKFYCSSLEEILKIWRKELDNK